MSLPRSMRALKVLLPFVAIRTDYTTRGEIPKGQSGNWNDLVWREESLAGSAALFLNDAVRFRESDPRPRCLIHQPAEVPRQ